MPPSDLVSFDPCTGAELWRGASASDAAVDVAVKTARAAFDTWARRPLTDRIAICESYRDQVRAKADEFATLISRETGKPLWEARTEVASVIAKVDISIKAYWDRTGIRNGEANGVQQAVRHKPHGALAVLGPYNFPAHLPNGHIVPALIAGNTIVFKPSELTPAVAAFMADCWTSAGLPLGVLCLLQGGAETGRALAGHEGLAGLLFTGSATTGVAIHRQFAGKPQKMLALEMGGVNPLIVWDVDDIEAAADIVIRSAYLSAGQRCTCARRLIVGQGVATKLVNRLMDLIDAIIVDEPFAEPQPFMGPVIDNRAATLLQSVAKEMIARGGRVLRPLNRPDRTRPFLTPALLDMTGVEHVDEEHFGPLLQMVRVPDFEAAIMVANATRYGLAAGLIGGDRALYDRFWAETSAGIVNWNSPTTGAASNAPFGGVGLSGNHRPSAYYAADYSAWPVASLETNTPIVGLAIGMRAVDAR